ncbi:MAG: DUF2851 family protein [Candidatus Cloacimonas sp.]|jgi:hypothetical protein|nr:DUF2851 family protein [Candidatus Cloacimonas sp.]
MEEKFLYHIWDAGHLRNDLQTVSGKAVKIVYQGQYNTFRGPDFVNAIISLNGENMQGAVEIHIDTNDWQKHAHQEDHFYNTVILHVVHKHSGQAPHTIKENGELVEILEIKDQLSEDIEKLITIIGTEGVKSGDSYCDLLSALDSDHLYAILSAHGKQRFTGKVRRFNAALSLSDFDQILYEGIMEAMGYDKNKFNTLQLAQSVPFCNLKQWVDEGLDLYGLSSILLVSSGLLQKSQNRIEQELYNKLLDAYERQSCYARKLTIDWQLFRIRPLNHPLHRIILICSLFFSSMPLGLLNRLITEVETGSPDPKTRYKRFRALLGKQENAIIPSRHLGSSVINNIYLNIYLPIMYLYAQKMADQNLAESIMLSWNNFTALADNYITRFMCRHVNSSQVKAVNAKSLYQQGLMDIFYRFCRFHRCEECKQSG